MGGQNLSAVIARRRAGMGNLRAGVPRERRSLIYLLDIFRPPPRLSRLRFTNASLIALGAATAFPPDELDGQDNLAPCGQARCDQRLQ